MISFRSSSLQRRFVTPLLIVTWLSGCTTWRVQTEPLQVVIAEQEPTRIRMTFLSGETREVKDPMVFGETVRGLWVREGFVDTMVEIPTDSVTQVEVLKTDRGRTWLLVLAVVVLPMAIALSTMETTTGRSGGSNHSAENSCPLVYSWDGSDWRLDSGTFGGAIFQPLARTDLDNLDYAAPTDGVLRLKLANELPETEHVDALSVLAVDHLPGVTIVPDGAATPHALASERSPIEAWDENRRNVLSELTWSDGWTWESTLTARDTAIADQLRDGVELVFERPAGATEARLLVDGHNTEWAAALVHYYVQLHGDSPPAWYASMNEDADRARSTAETFARAGFLQTDLMTQNGWAPQGLFWEAGPEIIKRQVMSVDLSEVEGDRVRIRLESIPSFWRIDRVAMDFGPAPEFSVTRISPRSATTEEGEDVGALLRSVDGDEWVMSQGDFAVLELEVPPVPKGLERTYLLETHGWYQIDATASGPPASDLLRRIEAGPADLAKVAVGLRNDALAMAMDAARRDASSASSPEGGRR